MNKRTSVVLSMALGSALTLTGCTDENDEKRQDQVDQAAVEETHQSEGADISMLQYIPADSPYYFANREQTPDQIFQNFLNTFYLGENAPASFENLRLQIQNASEELNASSNAAVQENVQKALSLYLAILDDLETLKTAEDIKNLGFHSNPKMAFYGLGVLPVFRLQIDDAATVEATLQRWLDKAELNSQKHEQAGFNYWTFDSQGPLQLMIAIKEGQWITSLLPKPSSEATPEESSVNLLAHIVGTSLPESSLEQTGALQEMENRNGFLPYGGSGQIVTARLINEIMDSSNPATMALFDALEIDKNNLSQLDQCTEDIARLTQNFPSIDMGMKDFSVNRLAASFIVATEPTIADDLKTLAAQVPGLGGQSGLINMGFGMDLAALTAMARKYASLVNSNPFKCESLHALNDGFQQANVAINNPMLMMAGQALSGLNVSLDSFDWNEGDFNFTGLVTLASSNPMTLLSSAAMFDPNIFNLNLTPGGEPRPLEFMQGLLPPQVPDIHAVMSDNAILLGVGISDAARLKAEVSSPVSEDKLLFNFGVGGEAFDVAKEILSSRSEFVMNTGVFSSEAELDNALQMMDSYKEIYRMIGMSWQAVDQGLELQYLIDLN